MIYSKGVQFWIFHTFCCRVSICFSTFCATWEVLPEYWWNIREVAEYIPWNINIPRKSRISIPIPESELESDFQDSQGYCTLNRIIIPIWMGINLGEASLTWNRNWIGIDFCWNCTSLVSMIALQVIISGQWSKLSHCNVGMIAWNYLLYDKRIRLDGLEWSPVIPSVHQLHISALICPQRPNLSWPSVSGHRLILSSNKFNFHFVERKAREIRVCLSMCLSELSLLKPFDKFSLTGDH